MWPGFYTPSLAWLFPALIPPLVVLYFLKLKRPRVEIPSLVLWRKVINDNRVNSPFQRFRRNILLLLQLILLVLLILAAMQPFLHGGEDRSKRLPILIDASASMAALDKAGGESRLEAAKRQVREIVDNLLPDQEVSLIVFSRSARRLTDFTNNKRVLHDAIDQIGVEDVPSNLDDALRVAQALAQGSAFERVVLFSDGNLPAAVNFDLPFALDYRRLDPAGPNFGVTTLTARASGAGNAQGWDIFAQFDASAEASGSATVELVQDGKVIASEPLDFRPGGTERVVFPIRIADRTLLEVRLVSDHFDSLASDNTAYLELAPPRPLWAYAPPSTPLARLALQSLDNVRVFPDEKGAPSDSDYDLVVSDKPADMERAAAVGMFIGFVPDDAKALVAIREEPENAPGFIDWTRTEPLLQYVNLAGELVGVEPNYAPNAGESNFEALGYDVIAHGRVGPLMLRRKQGTRVSYFLLFQPEYSTLRYSLWWPMMIQNLAQVAAEASGLSERRGARTGVLPDQQLDPAAPGAAYTVRGPRGLTRSEKSDERGLLTGVAAPYTGRYTISGGGQGDTEIGVSLLDEGETKLAGVDEIQFREVDVAAANDAARPDRTLWTKLAWLALGVLLVEWWFFQRRFSSPGR